MLTRLQTHHLSLVLAALAVCVVLVVMATKSPSQRLSSTSFCDNASTSSSDATVTSLLQRNAALKFDLARIRDDLQSAIPKNRAQILSRLPAAFPRSNVSALQESAALAGDRFELQLLLMLHRAALDEAHAAGRALDGFIRGNRRRAHASLVGTPLVRTVCETGFNFGFAAAVWLMANEDVRVLSFDLLEADAPWKRHSVSRLHALFGVERLRVVPGNSSRTVDAFAAHQRANVSCDVVHVDGDHRGSAPLGDLIALRALAHPGAFVLVDDVGTCGYCRDPATAWATAIERGIVRQLACFDTTVDDGDTPLTEVDKGHQFCIGMYV
jgi:predicted O-methyltransferase YrrM